MLVRARVLAALAMAAVLLAGALTACTAPRDERTLTYWASNQGASTAQDLEILRPELDKFTARTGIEVDVEVIAWSDLLNRILGAATSGVGPDVVNLGNTWSASLQATGAFVTFDDEVMRRLGGRDRFVASSMTSAGMAGREPSSVPLYGLSYGLFYNKRLFAEAGITTPPRTWAEFLDVAARLTDPARDRRGLVVAGASYTENAHFAFIFGRQHGVHFIDEQGRARFTSPRAIDAVQRYVELMSAHRVVEADDAEIGTTSEAVSEFTNGRAAMLIAQNSAIAAMRSNGMPDDAYGVAPMPVLDPLPRGGQAVRSHVAGSNIAVFADSPKREQALRLVEFLTSAEEQRILNGAYGTLPVVRDAYDDPVFRSPANETFAGVLARDAEPMPMIPAESRFETTIGAAIRDLFARAATGQPVRREDVREALADAEQKMNGSGGG
ncbi:sugar ABC transporter substrate-binding protein [Saccharopolyspora erythraea]|uniref:ABC transporter substrate-binding protein n=1 Tax=Saccharopolyspora erythraea TaxID=1836 RepID=UPI001BAAF011|nr:sugar ABC transporter substrate-binding protein [Saccharopolyspora erythraea]QUH01389.1 sugar ABC transporter substrate-binding protein [Saccharopolyspora erythraea]